MFASTYHYDFEPKLPRSSMNTVKLNGAVLWDTERSHTLRAIIRINILINFPKAVRPTHDRPLIVQSYVSKMKHS